MPRRVPGQVLSPERDHGDTVTMRGSASASKLITVLRVTIGGFLEMFDLFPFGLCATHIARAFFPAGNEITSLLLTFMTLGAGFLTRPLEAVILGAYVDRIGRRRSLIALSPSWPGTILIALVPGYATIGLFAPCWRWSAGGVLAYLAEMATPGRKGFAASW